MWVVRLGSNAYRPFSNVTHGLATFQSLSKVLLTSALVVSITAFMILLMSLLAQFVSRSLFNTGLIWSDELARICFVWCSFFGAVAAWQTQALHRIDMLTRRLTGGASGFCRPFGSNGDQFCIGLFALAWFGHASSCTGPDNRNTGNFWCMALFADSSHGHDDARCDLVAQSATTSVAGND